MNFNNDRRDLQLIDSANDSNPISFVFKSNEILGLLLETVQLVKLITTEKRDLEAIRADKELRAQFLTNIHREAISYIENSYRERSQIISAVEANTKLLIQNGQYELAQQIMIKLTDFLANNSPLRTSLEWQSHKL